MANERILKGEIPGAKDVQEDTLSDTSAARKPVDVSDVWGGVQNRFKNAAADRTSNPLFYGRSQKRALRNQFVLFRMESRSAIETIRNFDEFWMLHARSKPKLMLHFVNEQGMTLNWIAIKFM